MKIFFFLIEFFEIVVYGICVSVWKDILNKDDHIVTMDQEDELTITFLLDIGQVVLLATVEFSLVFDEVNDFDKASLHILQKFLLIKYVLLYVFLETFVYLILLTSLLQHLPFLLGHFRLLVRLLIVFHLQDIVSDEIVVLCHIRNRVQDFWVQYLAHAYALQLVLDLFHQMDDILFQTIPNKVLHYRKIHLILDTIRHLELISFAQHFFEEVYLQFLIQHLQKYRHEAFDDGVLLKVDTGKACKIKVVVAAHDIQVKLFWYCVVQDLRVILALNIPSYCLSDCFLFNLLLIHFVKDGMFKELMPLDSSLFRVGKHTLYQGNEFS